MESHGDSTAQMHAPHRGGSILDMDVEMLILNMSAYMPQVLGLRPPPAETARRRHARPPARASGIPYPAAILALTTPGGMGEANCHRQLTPP